MNAQQRIRNEMKNARGRDFGMDRTETKPETAPETVPVSRIVPEYVGTLPGLIVDRRALYTLGS